MDFNDIARRNSAWTQAYKNVAKPSGATPPAVSPSVQSGFENLYARAMKGYDSAIGGLREFTKRFQPGPNAESADVLKTMEPGMNAWAASQNKPVASVGTSAPAPQLANRSQLQWGNIQRDARQMYGDSYGKVSPGVVRDARRSVTSELMGGVPMGIMDAKLQGRRDAAEILNRAAQPKAPSELSPIRSPLGASDAANFRALSAIDGANDSTYNENFKKWQQSRDANSIGAISKSPYLIPILEGLSERLGREPTAQEVADAGAEFSSKYLVYSKGNVGNPNKMRPGDFAYKYFAGGDPEIDRGVSVAMDAAAADRAARGVDRTQRAERMSAINQFRSSGVLPSDPDMARAIVAGAGVAGNPFAAAMSKADAERQAQMEIAQRQLEATKYAADTGLKGQEAQTAARVAEAEAARTEAARRFDAQMAEVTGNRTIAEQRLANEKRATDMNTAMGMPDPIAVANDIYRKAIDGYVAQGYPVDQATQRATVEARGAYDSAVNRANVAKGFGVAVPDYGAFPEQFAYTPPRVDASLEDGVRRATVDDLVSLVQASSVKGEKLTPERLKEVAAANGLYVDDSVIDEFHSVAGENRGLGYAGLQWLFGSGAGESAEDAYRKVYGGEPFPGMGGGSFWQGMGYVPPHLRK